MKILFNLMIIRINNKAHQIYLLKKKKHHNKRNHRSAFLKVKINFKEVNNNTLIKKQIKQLKALVLSDKKQINSFKKVKRYPNNQSIIFKKRKLLLKFRVQP